MSDGTLCVICFEPWTNFGDHQVCSLKCGHLFGKICIDKWLQSKPQCPQCQAKAKRIDIRVLFVSTLLAVKDMSEIGRLKAELAAAHAEISSLKALSGRLELEADVLRAEVSRLRR